MGRKFVSRKMFAAILAFITVNVLPNIPTDQRAKWSAAISVAYITGQSIADAFGSQGVGSQGEKPPPEPPPAP